jgi:hypothetical protein
MRTVVCTGLFSAEETRELLAALQSIENRHPDYAYAAFVTDDDQVFDDLQRLAEEGSHKNKHKVLPRLLT